MVGLWRTVSRVMEDAASCKALSIKAKMGAHRSYRINIGFTGFTGLSFIASTSHQNCFRTRIISCTIHITCYIT